MTVQKKCIINTRDKRHTEFIFQKLQFLQLALIRSIKMSHLLGQQPTTVMELLEKFFKLLLEESEYSQGSYSFYLLLVALKA
jgi:hypothetical protein